MFKKILLLSFFVEFSVDSIGACGFVITDFTHGGPDHQRPINQEELNATGIVNAEVVHQNNGGSKDLQIINEGNSQIINNSSGDEEVVLEDDDFRQLVLYYYIAVSFLFYMFNEIDVPKSGFFSAEKRCAHYKGPVDDDVFAVYRELSGSNLDCYQTYKMSLLSFCEKYLQEFLNGKEKVSYEEAYKKLYQTVQKFLDQERIRPYELGEDSWKSEESRWVFTVALQVFAYKKIYNYICKGICKNNNLDGTLYHDFNYVKFMSKMLFGIFKSLYSSFADRENILYTRQLFFLKKLPLIVPNGRRLQINNIFCDAFSNLVFRPVAAKGSSPNFLDCFNPIIQQL